MCYFLNSFFFRASRLGLRRVGRSAGLEKKNSINHRLQWDTNCAQVPQYLHTRVCAAWIVLKCWKKKNSCAYVYAYVFVLDTRFRRVFFFHPFQLCHSKNIVSIIASRAELHLNVSGPRCSVNGVLPLVVFTAAAERRFGIYGRNRKIGKFSGKTTVFILIRMRRHTVWIKYNQRKR